MGKNKVQSWKIKKSFIRRGVSDVKTIFVTGGVSFPQLIKKPLRSLGSQYTTDLSYRQMGKLARQQLTESVARIEQSHLPGKHKMWCGQHTLYECMLWALKVCEIPMS